MHLFYGMGSTVTSVSRCRIIYCADKENITRKLVRKKSSRVFEELVTLVQNFQEFNHNTLTIYQHIVAVWVLQ